MQLRQMKPFMRQHVHMIRHRLQAQRTNSEKHLLLFELGISTALRVGDLVSLRASAVYPEGRDIPTTIVVMQEKTGKPAEVRISTAARSALVAWKGKRSPTTDWLFPAPSDRDHFSKRQVHRLVKYWAEYYAGLDPTMYGCHSLRRTMPALLYQETGNIRAIQKILGHKSLAYTQEYLGVDMQDALDLAERYEP